MEIKKGIAKAVESTIADIKKNSKEINEKEEIAHVASISANNDEEIGNLIADSINSSHAGTDRRSLPGHRSQAGSRIRMVDSTLSRSPRQHCDS